MAESVSGSVSSSCAVCRRYISVTAAGLIRQHGPLRSRCPGSHQHPGPDPGVSPPLSQQPLGPEGMRTAPLPYSQTSSDTQQCPLKCLVKVLKQIPRLEREQAASKLAVILDSIVSKNDYTSWSRLLQFSTWCLHVPAQRAERCSLAFIVNSNWSVHNICILSISGVCVKYNLFL